MSTLRIVVPGAAALYAVGMALIVAISVTENGVGVAHVVVAGAVAVGVWAFLWGVRRWEGAGAWGGRVVGWVVLLGAAVLGIQVVLFTLPLLVLAVPLLRPGVRDSQ